MTKEEYKGKFDRALKLAADEAQRVLGKEIPRDYIIQLHGAGHPGDLMSSNEALQALYLGPEKSFVIVDVGIKETRGHQSIVFVRASDHRPASYDAVWDAANLGPFKVIGPALKWQGTDH